MNKMIPFLLSVLFTIFSPSDVHSFDGPLQVKNQFPLFLHVDAPYLESASIEDSFAVSMSYSSVFLVEDSPKWSIGLDMEMSELDFIFRKSISNFIEFSLDLPILSFASGFMDSLLSSYHDAFGFPDYGRSRRPDNEFLYEVRQNGGLVVKGKNGHMGIGDANLSIKKPILEGDPGISVRGDIEFPTGEPETGYGNGSIDAGLAILLDKSLSEKIRSYLNLGVIFPGDLRGHEKVALREFLYGGAAVEAEPWRNIDLNAQVFVQGSPFPETDIVSVDRTAVTLSLGGRYHRENNSFEFSFTEDPNTSGAPDFTVNFSFKRKF